MQKTETRVSELVRWNAKKGGRYVQALELDLDKEAEGRVGKVYGIMAVDAPAKVGEALFAHVEDAFLRGVHEALRNAGADAGHEQTFESAIAHVNHAVSRMFGEHGFGIEPEFVSAALLSLRDHDVVAAVWGRPSVLLYHASPNRPVKVLDLVDDSAAEPPPFRTAPVKRCFGSVISGRIGGRDRLLLATQDLREIIGAEELESYATAEDHATATALIRERLAPVSEDLSIAALVLDVAPVRYVEDVPAEQRSGPQASLADLRKMQTRTNEVLSPFPISAIQKRVAEATAAATEKLHTLGRPKEAHSPETPAVPEPAPQPTQVNDVDILGHELTAAAAPKEKEPAMVSAAYAAKDALRAAGRAAATAAKAVLSPAARYRGAMTVVTRFNDLAPRSRYLLFFALFLVMSFNTSVYVGSLQRTHDEALALDEGRFSTVDQKIDAAEASVIYKDEERARSLLVEASTAIAALPDKKPADKEKKDALLKRVADVTVQLRHEIALPPPEVVATVATAGGEPALSRIASDAGTIWGASDDGDVFRISVKDGVSQKAASLPGGAAPKAVVMTSTGLIVAAASGDAALVPAKGAYSEKKIQTDPKGGAIDDAAIYGSWLYVLDAAHNRILRQSPDKDGYGKPQFYLKDGTDVSSAVSISIDGSVYVLRKDGSVARVSKGLQDGFTLAKADPPIADARRIRTIADTDDIYVLDGSPARIVRFSKKSGSLIAQLTSPSLEGATDFTVDPKTKTAIVSVKNQLLRFSLPQ